MDKQLIAFSLLSYLEIVQKNFTPLNKVGWVYRVHSIDESFLLPRLDGLPAMINEETSRILR